MKKDKKKIDLLERVEEIFPEENFLKADGFDDCIIGVSERFGQEAILVYDKDKIIKSLMKDMTEEEALEYFDFNIIGAWVGDKTPAFITRV